MKYAFQLYICDGMPGSILAVQNLELICKKLGQKECEVEIIDIRTSPKKAEEARVLAIPTLIKCRPLPLLRVVGDLSEHSKILEALGHSASFAVL